MKLKNFIVILFLLAIGCNSIVAQEKESASKYHLVLLKCEIREKATNKMLDYATLQLYSLPDTTKVGSNTMTFHAGEGYSDRKSLQIGKFLARVFVMNVEVIEKLKDESGVTGGYVKMTENNEYEPKWIELEITEADAKAGEKKLDPVFLEKKKKFSVPKPAEVKHSEK